MDFKQPLGSLLVTLILLSSWLPLPAQHVLQGTVTDRKSPLPFATVLWEPEGRGTAGDEGGRFELDGLMETQGTLTVSAIGYRSRVLSLQLDDPLTDLGAVPLEEDRIGLETLVVTGTMSEQYVTSAPVKVEVLTANYLADRIAPTNMVEAVSLVSGVEEVVACGVCYTNSISIHGLPGAYTAILVDGAPIYGNLASVYGLNSIPASMVDRYEVVKGPASTLYGTEAVAGVINVITKKAKRQPLLQADLMGSTHGEAFGNLALAPRFGRWSGWVGGNFAYLNRFDDGNGDGFSDAVDLDRLSIFTKWSLDRSSGKRFDLTAKLYAEDRRNGVEDYLRDRAYRELRGSDSIYGESIYTARAELFGTWELPSEEDFALSFSASAHDQDSYYGADHYDARQYLAQADLRWHRKFGEHDLHAGSAMRYNYYDDNTVATADSSGENAPESRVIPGLYMQDEWAAAPKWTLLGGLRLDYYKTHGPVAAPRIAARYELRPNTLLRARFGTGFRLVNLFAEDHAFVTGQRTVEIAETLKPERSWSLSFNANHNYTGGEHQGMIDADIHYTRFSNKIIPDYDKPGKIVYANAEGFATSAGLGLSWSHAFPFPLTSTLSGNYSRAIERSPDPSAKEGWSNRDLEFAPLWSGTLNLLYDWDGPGLSFSYTAKMTGPMALPEVFDLGPGGQPQGESRPTRSKAFSLHTFQVTKYFLKANLELYAGVQNLLNYRQEGSPLAGYDDPNFATGFSPFFDTAYAYAPSHGREAYLGLRWNLAGRKPRP